MTHKNGYYSPTKGSLSAEQMVDEISGFVVEDSDSFYRLVIGTDSQVKRVNGHPECDYITAIVVHRIGKGARYFWSKEVEEQPKALRDKIYSETVKSLNTAQKLVPSIQKAISPSQYDFEIHIDVGPKGPTREMIKEVVGMVTGNGFTAKTKPESWAASSVADKHT